MASYPTAACKLYRRYVDGMLGLWDDRRQVVATDVPLSQTQKHQIMRGLALRMFLEGQEQWDEPVIVNGSSCTFNDEALATTDETPTGQRPV